MKADRLLSALDEDWRTRVPGLDAAELRALLMAQPRVLGDSRLAAAAERARQADGGAARIAARPGDLDPATALR